ncbi:hypothetical protein V1520DRAFT_201856 [Lipomyces starkeyi]|uniref:Uncharacterized protein n=1 Tax=Lipomyces starkeyi NRRL Y-11557 TaxID=675824 RepID=A0A1E3Q7R8_LIPST|nr:hypothetical protein LIPSTDRAFT_270035 [Lipomyces starkeyi NRRL Y-11557]
MRMCTAARVFGTKPVVARPFMRKQNKTRQRRVTKVSGLIRLTLLSTRRVFNICRASNISHCLRISFLRDHADSTKQFFNENPPPYEDNSGSRQHYVASAADRLLHDEAHSSFYLEKIMSSYTHGIEPDMRAIPVLFMELWRASVIIQRQTSTDNTITEICCQYRGTKKLLHRIHTLTVRIEVR